MALVTRDAGTTLKLGGGGGSKGNPYPKLKTLLIWPTIFWSAQVHEQKQTKIRMNDNDSPKLGGRRPHSFQVGGGGGGGEGSCLHRPRPGSRVPASYIFR